MRRRKKINYVVAYKDINKDRVRVLIIEAYTRKEAIEISKRLVDISISPENIFYPGVIYSTLRYFNIKLVCRESIEGYMIYDLEDRFGYCIYNLKDLRDYHSVFKEDIQGRLLKEVL